MAHLDLKIRLESTAHSNALKQRFESMGAKLLFSGKEEDKIFYLKNNAFLKQRHSYGIGDKRWAFDSASDEFIGYNELIELVPVNQRLQILYRKIPSVPAPHYIIPLQDDMQRGIEDHIFTPKGLYSEVNKQRDIYRLPVNDENQGSPQTNLRLHFDTVMQDKPYHFLEIEAKFPNDYRREDIVQAEKQLEKIKQELKITPEQLTTTSYGSMVRQFKMQGLELTNDWLEDVPLHHLEDLATSPHREYKANDFLMKKNAYNDGSYVMLDGSVRVDYKNEQYRHGHGKVIGELATMNRTHIRCADVVAIENKIRALHLSKELTFALAACSGVADAWSRRYLPRP